MDVDDNGHIDEIFNFMCEPILAPLQEVYFLIIPEKATEPHPLDFEFARRNDEYSVFSRSRRKMLLDLVGYKTKSKKLVHYSLGEMLELNNCDLAKVQLDLDPYIQKGVPFAREVTFNFVRDGDESLPNALELNERKRRQKKNALKREGKLKRLKTSQDSQDPMVVESPLTLPSRSQTTLTV